MSVDNVVKIAYGPPSQSDCPWNKTGKQRKEAADPLSEQSAWSVIHQSNFVNEFIQQEPVAQASAAVCLHETNSRFQIGLVI